MVLVGFGSWKPRCVFWSTKCSRLLDQDTEVFSFESFHFPSLVYSLERKIPTDSSLLLLVARRPKMFNDMSNATLFFFLHQGSKTHGEKELCSSLWFFVPGMAMSCRFPPPNHKKRATNRVFTTLRASTSAALKLQELLKPSQLRPSNTFHHLTIEKWLDSLFQASSKRSRWDHCAKLLRLALLDPWSRNGKCRLKHTSSKSEIGKMKTFEKQTIIISSSILFAFYLHCLFPFGCILKSSSACERLGWKSGNLRSFVDAGVLGQGAQIREGRQQVILGRQRQTNYEAAKQVSRSCRRATSHSIFYQSFSKEAKSPREVSLPPPSFENKWYSAWAHIFAWHLSDLHCLAFVCVVWYCFFILSLLVHCFTRDQKDHTAFRELTMSFL